MQQFLAQGLHLTERRTGVLIFASVAERYAEIVADSGINAKVTPDAWTGAVAALVSAIKAGRPGDGFVAAIELCGTELARHFPPGALNPNELPNRVVEI
jgi:putative membrane protein